MGEDKTLKNCSFLKEIRKISIADYKGKFQELAFHNEVDLTKAKYRDITEFS